MNEKGLEPPPRPDRALDDVAGQQGLYGWFIELDKWFRRLVDAVPRVRTYSVAWDPASVAANTTAEQTVTVTGLSTQDIVTVNKPSHQAGLGIAGARVSAANTLAVTFVNATAGAIDPTSETYFVVAVRR